MDQEIRDQVLRSAQEALDRETEEINRVYALAIWAAQEKFNRVVGIVDSLGKSPELLFNQLTGKQFAPPVNNHLQNNITPPGEENSPPGETVNHPTPGKEAATPALELQRMAVWEILSRSRFPRSIQQLVVAYNKTHPNHPIEKGAVSKFLVMLKRDGNVISDSVAGPNGPVNYYQLAERTTSIKDGVAQMRAAQKKEQ